MADYDGAVGEAGKCTKFLAFTAGTDPAVDVTFATAKVTVAADPNAKPAAIVGAVDIVGTLTFSTTLNDDGKYK